MVGVVVNIPIATGDYYKALRVPNHFTVFVFTVLQFFFFCHVALLCSLKFRDALLGVLNANTTFAS